MSCNDGGRLSKTVLKLLAQFVKFNLSLPQIVLHPHHPSINPSDTALSYVKLFLLNGKGALDASNLLGRTLSKPLELLYTGLGLVKLLLCGT